MASPASLLRSARSYDESSSPDARTPSEARFAAPKANKAPAVVKLPAARVNSVNLPELVVNLPELVGHFGPEAQRWLGDGLVFADGSGEAARHATELPGPGLLRHRTVHAARSLRA